jgi:uncharacterized RDD family membrane protein YckC
VSEPFQPPPSTQSIAGGPSGPRAGFWVRLGAFFIDLLIVAGVGIVLVIIGAAAGSSALETVGWVIFVLGHIVYDIYFHGRPAGQTVGKHALGIRVIDFSTGGPIGYGKATLRYVGRFISGFFCYLGYLWMLWDKEKQAWHDKIANDVVVPTSAYPVEHWP